MNNYVTEAIQHPKTLASASGVISGAIASLAENWNFSDPNIIIALIGLGCTILMTVFAWLKSKREKKEHELRIRLIEKQLADKGID